MRLDEAEELRRRVAAALAEAGCGHLTPYVSLGEDGTPDVFVGGAFADDHFEATWRAFSISARDASCRACWMADTAELCVAKGVPLLRDCGAERGGRGRLGETGYSPGRPSAL